MTCKIRKVANIPAAPAATKAAHVRINTATIAGINTRIPGYASINAYERRVEAKCLVRKLAEAFA